MITNQETQLKRKEILHALDLEIEQIQKEVDRPGWTIWAMLGALATSIWLLLDVIENSKFNLQAGLFTFLTISILFDSLNILIIFSKSGATRATNPRFRLTNEFSNSRHLFFLSALRAGLLLYLGFIFSGWISGLPSKIFYIGYGGYIFFLFFIFILSFAKIPILLDTATKKSFKILNVIISIGLMILVIGFSKAFYENLFIIKMPVFRFGGLLWTISFLIMKLGSGALRPILLESLIEIRRDLILERINLFSASKQFDIALSGLEVSDLLQAEIREILQIYDQISKEYKIADDNLKTIKNVFENKDSKEADFKLIRALIDSFSLHFKKVEDFFVLFNEKSLKHAKHIKRLLIFYPYLEENLTAPKNKLLETVNSLSKESEIFFDQYKSFSKRLTEKETEKEK